MAQIAHKSALVNCERILYSCADLEGGAGGSGPPLEFAKLNIADITGNEKLVIFHICSLPVIRQTESIHITSIQVCVMGFFLLKVGPPLEKFSGSAPGLTY